MNKIKYFIFFYAFVLTITNVFGQTWETLSDASGNAAYRHDDVYFVSTAVGYTVYYNAAASTKLGTIYKTTNGGQSWFPVKTSAGTHFRCITFMDASIGIAGNLGKGTFNNAYDTIPVYRTTDGGQTWTGTNPFPAGLKGLCALFKINQQTIYGVGRVQGPAYLLKSSDKGANWNVSNLSTAGLGAAMDLYFFNADTGFVVGMDSTPYQSGSTAPYKGKVIYTTDGGQTWTTVLRERTINPSYFWKIVFPSRKVGYTTLQQNTSTYTTVVYYKTTDGGLTWTKNEIPTTLFGPATNLFTQGIGFIDENKGWIGGGGSTPNFLETNNGGTSWSNITSQFSYRINKLRIFGDTVYASGIRIHRWGRPKTTTSLAQVQTQDYVTIYPNPVQQQLIIKMREDIWNKGTASIYTTSGNEILSQSIHGETMLDLSSFAPGTYYIKVYAGEKMWISKIVKE